DIEGLSVEEDGRMYLWEKDGLFHEGTDHWLRPYRNVYYANTVLERIVDIPRDSKNQTQWDDIKGQALFLRARSFLSTVLIWSLAYDEQTASTDKGIPIRLTADYNVKSKRASVRESYDQVILDLKTAAELLPVTP